MNDTEAVELILATLREVVDEAGEEYVYPEDHKAIHPHGGPTGQVVDGVGMCSYVHDGQPDCIAARVLAKLGVPLSILEQYEGRPANFLPLPITEYPWWTSNAREVLRAAQRYQDNGSKWGMALRMAQAEATRFNQ